MFNHRAGPALVILLVLLMTVPAQAQESSARAAVQSFFALLRDGRYAELYDYLPAEMQKRMTRRQLAERLGQLADFLVLERMEIGQVQQRRIDGQDFAVIDTTLYGRLRRPVQINGQKLETGKVVVQQYLFREGSQWKVATAEGSIRSGFLKRHPEFGRQFRLRSPQFFFRQDGEWKPLRR